MKNVIYIALSKIYSSNKKDDAYSSQCGYFNIKEGIAIPSGIHHVNLATPIENVWTFISDMNQWAPLVPGYIEHTIVTDRQSIWTFTGEVGVVQKTIQLEVNIKKWQKPTSITFELKGLNENVKGHGYFNAQEIDWNHTNITGFLNLSAKGMLGPMVNSILRSYVPKTTVQLTEAVVLKMKQSQPVPL